MGKKTSKQQKKAAVGMPTVIASEIDYDKLAEAIVRAHDTIENEKQKQADREAEQWRKKMGVKVFPDRPIRQFLNDMTMVKSMVFIKRSDATTGGATYSLIRQFSEFFFGAVEWALYLIAIILFACGIYNAFLHPLLSTHPQLSTHPLLSTVLFVVHSLLALLFARLFRIARFEVGNMQEREEILSVSSTIAAIMALIVSIVNLVVGVLLR